LVHGETRAKEATTTTTITSSKHQDSRISNSKRHPSKSNRTITSSRSNKSSKILKLTTLVLQSIPKKLK